MPTPLYIAFERKRLAAVKNRARVFGEARHEDPQAMSELSNALKSLRVSLQAKPVPENFSSMRLDLPTMKAIVDAMGERIAYQAISEEDVVAAKEFTGALFDIDLSGVKVNVIDEPHSEDTEGFYLACDRNEGEVFVPLSFESPRELIAHELGHAAHFMLRRQSDDPALWLGSPVEAEMCAYYAQLNFLLAHCDRTRFYRALGALSTFCAFQAIEISKSRGDTNRKFLRSSEYAPYDLPATQEFVRRAFDGDPTYTFQQQRIRNGYGFCLALKLVDERVNMRKFARTDSSVESIRKKLAACFPDRSDLFNLYDVPKTVAALAARFD